MRSDAPRRALPFRVLSPDQCGRLLDELCVRLGFCLPPVERQRLAENPPREVLAFTDAVFVAEDGESSGETDSCGSSPRVCVLIA